MRAADAGVAEGGELHLRMARAQLALERAEIVAEYRRRRGGVEAQASAAQGSQARVARLRDRAADLLERLERRVADRVVGQREIFGEERVQARRQIVLRGRLCRFDLQQQ